MTDTERLYFVMSRGYYMSNSRDGEACRLVNPLPDSEIHEDKKFLVQKKVYGNHREAIDAAMSGEDGIE